MTPELPVLLVADGAAWRTWLGENYPSQLGVWLVLAKKGTTQPTTLSYDDALDEALCFGWIDGQKRRRDEATFAQRFTPRRSKGAWSARNVGIVARLVGERRMHVAGLAEVQRAKADGRWDAAYLGSARIEMPDDFAAALATQPAAQAMFDLLTSQNRYALLYRIGEAKRPETRARRLEQFVAMLARGETLYPQRRTLDG